MAKILQVIASHKGLEIGRCNYTWLNPLAYNSSRNFTFKDFVITNPIAVDNSGHSFINVSVCITNTYGAVIELNKFKIVPIEHVDFIENGDIKVYGNLVPDWYTDVYEQPLIDVFYLWDNENSFVDIEKVPETIHKFSYFQARGIFSGLPKQLIQGTVIIDAELIEDTYDFYDALAINLVGKKGFMGSSYDSLVDCLIESHNGNSSIHLIFTNTAHLKVILGNEYLNDIVCLFEQYNINIQLL